MDRRTVLKLAGGAGAIGSSVLSGCLGFVDDLGDDACETDHRWCYGVGGDLDAVADGTVFVRERSDQESAGDGIFESGSEADGEVVALDAATGDPEWTYGGTGQLDSYSELTVTDGVYFGHCGDDDCLSVYALEKDGQERWTVDSAGTWRRPLVVDGVVYVWSRTGTAWAFDAETGAERWSHRVGDWLSGAIVDVGDAVYAGTDSTFVALDRDGGSPLWEYAPDGVEIVDETVSDGVAYLVTSKRVIAVADGDELWRRDFQEDEVDVDTEIAGIESGRLFVFAEIGRSGHRLYAFDGTTGERDWVSDPEYRPQAAVHDGTVYVGAERVRALDAATGDERWSATLDGDPVYSMTVVEGDVGDDHAVFVAAGSKLAGFTPDGERTWEGSVDGEIRDYLVDDLVFVATDEAIHALDRQDGA